MISGAAAAIQESNDIAREKENFLQIFTLSLSHLSVILKYFNFSSAFSLLKKILLSLSSCENILRKLKIIHELLITFFPLINQTMWGTESGFKIKREKNLS